MPCIFCIAVFAILGTAVASTVLDQLESRLATDAASPVRRVTDSGSVRTLEFDFPLPSPTGGRLAATAPVAVTVYKRYGRARIQVLTHNLDRAQAYAMQQRIAVVAGLRIVEWSNPAIEQKVHDAVQAEAAAQPATSALEAKRPPQER